MNYSKHRRAIEKLYTDVCTVYRQQKVTNPVTKETTYEPIPIHSDKPCRISQKALPGNGQTEAQNTIRYEIKLFISPELEIKQGDDIEVTRMGAIQKYQAGEPFPYPTHQEVSLQRRGNA